MGMTKGGRLPSPLLDQMLSTVSCSLVASAPPKAVHRAPSARTSAAATMTYSMATTPSSSATSVAGVNFSTRFSILGLLLGLYPDPRRSGRGEDERKSEPL